MMACSFTQIYLSSALDTFWWPLNAQDCKNVSAFTTHGTGQNTTGRNGKQIPYEISLKTAYEKLPHMR